jgi:isoleucyl-tRNA synthetase
MAPFTPFIAEEIYKNLTLAGQAGKESVHLADFPVADEKLIDKKLNDEMQKTREIITEALQLRAKAGVKVRQPLRELRIMNAELRSEFVEIIKEELNVKGVGFGSEKIELDTEITPELKLEGQAREIIRAIQEMRKEAGFEVDNRIKVGYAGGDEIFNKFGDLIAREVLADEIGSSSLLESDLEKEFPVDGLLVKISIKR